MRHLLRPALLLASLLAACGSDGPTVGLDELCTLRAQVQCVASDRCAPPGQDPGAVDAQCVADLNTRCCAANDCNERIAWNDAQQITLDTCLVDIEAETCFNLGEDPPSCLASALPSVP